MDRTFWDDTDWGAVAAEHREETRIIAAALAAGTITNRTHHSNATHRYEYKGTVYRVDWRGDSGLIAALRADGHTAPASFDNGGWEGRDDFDDDGYAPCDR